MSPEQTKAFLRGRVDEVAVRLLGCGLELGGVELVISEVEAYAGPEDTASHARFGHTPRNAPMWAEAGHIYVYLCYGVHNMLNLVTGEEGQASAVLIRGCAVRDGHSLVVERRGGRRGADALAGPGKVGQALGLDCAWSGQRLGAPDGLQLRAPEICPDISCGPRIGIGFADPADQARPWRFAALELGGVTHAKSLTGMASPRN